MLDHGGKLLAAARQYNIPLDHWLDLSTGINPHQWPVPPLPEKIWSRLPEDEDGLEDAAAHYYGVESLLAVAGSQSAIQAIPGLRPACTVAILHPAYAEHAHNWRQAGHNVMLVSADNIDNIIHQVEVLVLLNPNNPDGQCFPVELLLDWHAQLSRKGGWLLIDEAFIDATPEQSMACYASRPGLIVLRSLGKFFGLPGLRCGFVLAADMFLTPLRELLGPWPLTTASRFIATGALRDHSWQQQMRRKLHSESQRLTHLLIRYELAPQGGCALFQWLQHDNAVQVSEQLRKQAILLRHFTDPDSLRFGLPADEPAWQKLERALASLKNEMLAL